MKTSYQTNQTKKQNRSQEETNMDESNFNSRLGNEEDIRKKAYELAERRGFMPGHELDDWLEAEKNIKAIY